MDTLGVSQPFERGEERSKDRVKFRTLCLSRFFDFAAQNAYGDLDRRAAPALPCQVGSLSEFVQFGI